MMAANQLPGAGHRGTLERGDGIRQVSRRSRLRILLRNRLAVSGLVIVLFWLLVSLLSPLLPLRDPYFEDLPIGCRALVSPATCSAPIRSARTCSAGCCHGGATSLELGALVVILGGVSG